MTLLHAAELPASESLTYTRGDDVLVVAGVVHDLGNLIQIAASAINILVRTPDMPTLHSGPILHRAQASLDHAGAIVRDAASGARGQIVTDRRSDVAAALAEVAALVDAMHEPGLRVDIRIGADLPEARCDPLGLRRAVLNLILNARDAIADAGTIRVDGRAVEGGVEICVTDHGIGMSRATIARVFDPLFTTKPDGLGGIGLPMVARFARGAGGDVMIESEPGVGTIVTLRLPAATPIEECHA